MATAAIASLRLGRQHPTFTPPTPRLRFGRKSGRPSLVMRSHQQVESKVSAVFTEDENALINALIGIQGRGRSVSSSQLQEVERAVQELEGLKGIPEPTGSSLIEGRWQLMFTTRPSTASPIQRTFVGVDSFSVFQEIYLRTDDPRVSNIVKFSDTIGELKVEAVASAKDAKRILFQFDRAAFSFKFLPFKVPYPVPFRLLGDEAKGWLDTTYLSQSGNIRISRGNKGTTFVLQKETEERQRLLSTISKGRDVREAIDKFITVRQGTAEGEFKFLEGEWLMIWNSQVVVINKIEFNLLMTKRYSCKNDVQQLMNCSHMLEVTESWIENASKGLMGKQIVKTNGQMKFLVDILFGVKFSMTGKYVKSGFNTYGVVMDDAAILAGPYGVPAEMETKFTLELLYADEKIRITRDQDDILFVHIRLREAV